jgi:predicted  nucleic acid-binding Zn-ribbon protein
LQLLLLIGRALKSGMESVMPEHSSIYFYLNWTKERLDEMDAALASLETKASKLTADAKVNAEELIGDLKRRRDEFQAKTKAQAEASEAAWEGAKTQLESQWRGFETQINTYFETVGKHIEQQQSTFRDIAAAQAKAWREAADKFHDAATKVAAEKRASLDSAIKQMRVDAAEAEGRLQNLKQAGSQSWAALSGALDESRKAFDKANQKAWEAFRGGVSR